MTMQITVHMLLKNEDIWSGFALQSVLPFAEKILIYDTGSTDETVKIIKSIRSPKIIFEERGEMDRRGLVDLRREMIVKTKTDWFLIVDGDEIWPKVELERLLHSAQSAPAKTVALVNRTRNCIGDIYHYLPEEAGQYSLAGRTGNLTIRLIRKTSDLTIAGEYPLEAYTNKTGPISEQDDRLRFVNCWYLHTTFLKRSSSDKQKTSGSFGKVKLPEKGIKITKDELPEVLFQGKNEFALKKRGVLYETVGVLTDPMIKIKRKRR